MWLWFHCAQLSFAAFLSKVDAKKDLIALYYDAETYAQSSALFETLAVVTPDGKWHKPGKMAWFGLISETDSELREWREK